MGGNGATQIVLCLPLPDLLQVAGGQRGGGVQMDDDIFFSCVLQNLQSHVGIKFKGLGGQDMFPGIYALFQKCPSARRGGDEHDSFYFRIFQKLIKIVADRDIVLFAEGICLFSDPVAHLDDTDELFIFHIPDDLPLCQPRTEAEPHQTHADGGDIGSVHFLTLSNLMSSTWACACVELLLSLKLNCKV